MINKTIQICILAGISFFISSCGKKIEEKAGTSKPGNVVSKQSEPTNKEETKTISDKVELLYNAIVANDTNLVESVLREVDSIEFTFINGETPLTLAIKMAKNEIVSKIISKSLDLNIPNKDGQSPLHLSIIFNKFLAFHALIKSGADINKVNTLGKSPLFYTLTENGERYFILLAIKGAELKIQIDEKEKSLSEILSEKKLDRALSLYKSIKGHLKVNVNQLIKSIYSSNTSFMSYLLENYDFYANYIKNNNVINYALDIADENKRIQTLEKLLAWGANPNITKGNTPAIIYAFTLGDIKAVELLSIYKANIKLKDQKNLNILDYAVKTLDFETIELLFAPIKLSFSYISKEEKQEYISMFNNACELIPEDEADVNMDYVQYFRLKNKVQYFLDCQSS